jgi:hypothetical protein
LVAIWDYGRGSRTTPSERARRAWKIDAILLLLGRLSFVALLFFMLPSAEVNEGRDKDPDLPKQCGPLKADFTDPCNAVLATLL